MSERVERKPTGLQGDHPRRASGMDMPGDQARVQVTPPGGGAEQAGGPVVRFEVFINPEGKPEVRPQTPPEEASTPDGDVVDALRSFVMTDDLRDVGQSMAATFALNQLNAASRMGILGPSVGNSGDAARQEDWKLPLPEVIARNLYVAIVEGDIEDRLPNEEKLAESFGVGRSTIRAALAFLDAGGVVEIRRGIGTFVDESTRVNLPDLRTTRSDSRTIASPATESISRGNVRPESENQATPASQEIASDARSPLAERNPTIAEQLEASRPDPDTSRIGERIAWAAARAALVRAGIIPPAEGEIVDTTKWEDDHSKVQQGVEVVFKAVEEGRIPNGIVFSGFDLEKIFGIDVSPPTAAGVVQRLHGLGFVTPPGKARGSRLETASIQAAAASNREEIVVTATMLNSSNLDTGEVQSYEEGPEPQGEESSDQSIAYQEDRRDDPPGPQNGKGKSR